MKFGQRPALFTMQSRWFTTMQTPQFKVFKNPVTSELDLLQAKLTVLKQQDPYKVFYPDAVEKIENKVIHASKANQKYSSYKLMRVCNLVRGKHIYDAIAAAGSENSKGG